MADTEPAHVPHLAMPTNPLPMPMLDGEPLHRGGPSEPPARSYTEVENALAVLQREAGLTDDTLKVLRKAVNDNVTVPRSGEGGQSSDEGGGGGGRKRPFKPSSSKRQQLTAEEASEVPPSPGAAAPCALRVLLAAFMYMLKPCVRADG